MRPQWEIDAIDYVEDDQRGGEMYENGTTALALLGGSK